MAEFVLLYSGGGRPETEEEQARVLKAWDDWYRELGSSIKDGGNPFAPGPKTVAGDGSVSDLSGTSLSGYTIVTADSLDAAVAMAKGSPVLSAGGEVHVYEAIPAM